MIDEIPNMLEPATAKTVKMEIVHNLKHITYEKLVNMEQGLTKHEIDQMSIVYIFHVLRNDLQHFLLG